MSTNTDQNTSNNSEDLFALKKENYKVMLIGIAVVVIGFLLMVGGGSEDPNVFNEEIFSARRITVAPITVLLGYAIIFYAILKKSDKPA